MTITRKIGTVALIGTGLFVVAAGFNYKQNLDREKLIMEHQQFEGFISNTFFERDGHIIRVTKDYKYSGFNYVQYGWCGEETTIEDHNENLPFSNVMVQTLIKNYSDGELIIMGKPYTAIPHDQVMHELKERYDGEKIIYKDNWTSSTSSISGPSYTQCSFRYLAGAKSLRPMRTSVSSSATIESLENGGYALFPSITIRDLSTKMAPYSTGTRRIMVNNVYKEMSIMSFDGWSQLSPARVGGSNDLIQLLKKSNSVTVGGYDVSAKGFTAALEKVKVANPDLVNHYVL